MSTAANLSSAALVDKINSGVPTVYFSASLVSLVSVLLVIASLVVVPRLRQHPAQLLFNR